MRSRQVVCSPLNCHFQNLIMLAPLAQTSNCRAIDKNSLRQLIIQPKLKQCRFHSKILLNFAISQICVVPGSETRFPQTGCTILSCRFHYVITVYSLPPATEKSTFSSKIRQVSPNREGGRKARGGVPPQKWRGSNSVWLWCPGCLNNQKMRVEWPYFSLNNRRTNKQREF